MKSLDISDRLTLEQAAALSYVRRHEPVANRADAIRRLRPFVHHLSRMIEGQAPLTINFHPDRVTPSGRTVIEEMFLSGTVKNQFETRITNGDPSAHEGGRRARRESQMFGCSYDGAAAHLRPKYGGLNVALHPLGGWPRFGSSHLVVNPTILPHCSFSIGNSLSGRAWIGTYDSLMSLMEDALENTTPVSAHPRRFMNIDGIIDVQMHGPVRLGLEVLAAQLDPSYIGTNVASAMLVGTQHYEMGFAWGPVVRSEPKMWKVPKHRTEVRVLIAGLADDHYCDAAWIGDVMKRHSFPHSMSSAQQDGVAKFLWNQTLLAHDALTVRNGPDLQAQSASLARSSRRTR